MKNIFILTALVLHFNLASQWKHTGGPYALHPVAIASDSVKAYAMIEQHGCLFKSTDHGTTWSVTSCLNADIVALAVTGNTLVAAEQLFAVTVSTNNGLSWAASNLIWNSVTTESARCLILVKNKLFLGTNAGVYCSVNNGFAWSKFSTSAPASVTGFAALGDTLFAGTDSTGIFCSADGGVTWATKNTGLGNLHIVSLAGNNVSTLAAATKGGVYVSTNGGNSWTLMSGLPSGLNVLAVELYNGHLYASTDQGVYRHDLTSSWTLFENGLTHPRVTFFHKAGGDLIAATAGAGICRYDGSGSLWANSSTGLTSGSSAIGLEKVDNVRFAASFSSGMYSDSAGTGWKHRNAGFYNPNVQSLAAIGNTLWAGSIGELYFSSDKGHTWTQSKQGIPYTPIRSITSSGNALVAGGCALQNAVYRSNNNGVSWTTVNTGLPTQCIFDLVSTGDSIFAATQASGVILSADQGLTWSTMNTGLPSTVAINIVEMANDKLYAGASDGLYSYDPGQNSWNLLKTASNVNALAVSGSSLYVGTGYFSYGGDFLFSPDNGTTWITKNDGLNFPFAIYDLLLDGDSIYAAFWFNGVYKRAIKEIFVDAPDLQNKHEGTLVFPVPAHDMITIQVTTELHKSDIRLFDLPGNERHVEVKNNMAGQYSVDISHLAPGIYFLSLEYCDGKKEIRRITRN